jgi:two-component system chemotaxis response regulator CheY
MRKMILAVDDSASVLQMAGFALRTAAYDVAEAVDGRDALSKLTGISGSSSPISTFQDRRD